MDLRLFLSTFALIFLAELGDKTQLAAFAASASARSPWTVFAGAATALVLSSLIAVLVGSTIHRFIPASYLKIGAGILFIGFGGLLLWNALKPQHEKAAVVAPAKPTVLARFILTLAADFEKSTSADYAAMARATAEPTLKNLFLSLADEEKDHLARVRRLDDIHGTVSISTRFEPLDAMTPDATAIDKDRASVLKAAAGHELATGMFYERLAEAVPIAGARSALRELAKEERSHAERLEQFLGNA
jgi:Ca2+/H+ antiporter, TMEM165/GDT1 family